MIWKKTSINHLVIKCLRKKNLIDRGQLIEILIKNRLRWNKFTLTEKSSDETYKTEIKMFR